MSVKTTDNTLQISRDTQVRASIALRAIGEDILQTSRPKTPKRLGNLRNDTRIQVLGLKGKVMWLKNYAAIQETKQFRNYTTGGTGPHFAEDAVKKVADRADSHFRRARLI